MKDVYVFSNAIFLKKLSDIILRARFSGQSRVETFSKRTRSCFSIQSDMILNVTDAAFFSSSTYNGKHCAKSSNLGPLSAYELRSVYNRLPTSIYALIAV